MAPSLLEHRHIPRASSNIGARSTSSDRANEALISNLSSTGIDIEDLNTEVCATQLWIQKLELVFLSFEDKSRSDKRRLEEICYVLDVDPFAIRALFEYGSDEYGDHIKSLGGILKFTAVAF